MKADRQFAVCVKNKGYIASLELSKVYEIIPDKVAVEIQEVRVIDESGQDYLYPEDYFVMFGKGTASAVPQTRTKPHRL